MMMKVASGTAGASGQKNIREKLIDKSINI